MEGKCILSKKMLLAICLFESWIKQFHKEKKIKYVALMDMFFSLLVSLFLGIITYFAIVIFLYISTKATEKNTYFYFSSLIRIILIYFVILVIVCLQNLFDEKFNIANKLKILILALFHGITVNRLILDVVKIIILYFGGWAVLIYTIATVFDPYAGTILKNEIQQKNIINAAMIFSVIIIVLVQVYGINNSYKSSRRKVIIYAISTIIATITTLNSIQKMETGQEFSYIFSVEYVSLTIALILSVDRLVSSLKTLVNEYNSVYNDTCCSSCIVPNLTYETITYKIKYFVADKQRFLKSFYQDFRKLSLLRKLFMVLSLAVYIWILFQYSKIMRSIERFQKYINGIFKQCIIHINNWMSQKLNFGIDYIYGDLLILLRIILAFIIFIIEIWCIVKAVASFKEILYQLKNRKLSKVFNESLLKELSNFGICTCFAVLIFLMPFAMLNLPIIKYILPVFDVLIIIVFVIFILISILKTWTKLNEKINQYKQSNDDTNNREEL